MVLRLGSALNCHIDLPPELLYLLPGLRFPLHEFNREGFVSNWRINRYNAAWEEETKPPGG